MITESLCQSCEAGDFERVLSIINRGANVNFNTGELSRTPLHYAAEYGQVEIVELLIHHGACLDAVDKFGFTPLLLAIIQNGFHASPHTKAANLAEARNKPLKTPFTHFATIKLLIQMGADVCIKDHTGNSIFHISASLGTLEFLVNILEQLNQEDEKVQEALPLTHARPFSMTKCKCLMRSPGWGYLTPLHYACCSAQLSTAKFLLESSAGCDPNSIDAYGWSPLHWAARNGNTDVCLLLLEYHADSTIQDVRGLTPPLIASIFHHDTLSRLIADYHYIPRQLYTSANSSTSTWTHPSEIDSRQDIDQKNISFTSGSVHDESFHFTHNIDESKVSHDAALSLQAASSSVSAKIFLEREETLATLTTPSTVLGIPDQSAVSHTTRGVFCIFHRFVTLLSCCLCVLESALRWLLFLTCLCCSMMGSLQFLFSPIIFCNVIASWFCPVVAFILLQHHIFLKLFQHAHQKIYQRVSFFFDSQESSDAIEKLQNIPLKKSTTQDSSGKSNRIRKTFQTPITCSFIQTLLPYAYKSIGCFFFYSTAVVALFSSLFITVWVIHIAPLLFWKPNLRVGVCFKSFEEVLNHSLQEDPKQFASQIQSGAALNTALFPKKNKNNLSSTDDLCNGVESRYKGHSCETKTSQWKYEGTSGGMIADMQHCRGVLTGMLQYNTNGDSCAIEASTLKEVSAAQNSESQTCHAMPRQNQLQSYSHHSKSNTKRPYTFPSQWNSTCNNREHSILAYSYSALSNSRPVQNAYEKSLEAAKQFADGYSHTMISDPALPGVFLPNMKATPASIVKGAFEGRYPGTRVWFTVLIRRLTKLREQRSNSHQNAFNKSPTQPELHDDFYQRGTGQYFELSFIEEKIFEWFIQRLERRQFEIVCNHWKLHKAEFISSPSTKSQQHQQAYDQHISNSTNHMAQVPDCLIRCRKILKVSPYVPSKADGCYSSQTPSEEEYDSESHFDTDSQEYSSITSQTKYTSISRSSHQESDSVEASSYTSTLQSFIVYNHHEKYFDNSKSPQHFTETDQISFRDISVSNGLNSSKTANASSAPEMTLSAHLDVMQRFSQNDVPENTKSNLSILLDANTPAIGSSILYFPQQLIPSCTMECLFCRSLSQLYTSHTINQKNRLTHFKPQDKRGTILFNPTDSNVSYDEKKISRVLCHVSSNPSAIHFSTTPELFQNVQLSKHSKSSRLSLLKPKRTKSSQSFSELSHPFTGEDSLDETQAHSILQVEAPVCSEEYPSHFESTTTSRCVSDTGFSGINHSKRASFAKHNCSNNTQLISLEPNFSIEKNELTDNAPRHGYSLETAWSIAVALLAMNDQLDNSNYFIFENSSFAIVPNEVESSALTNFEAVLDSYDTESTPLNQQKYYVTKVECSWIFCELYSHLIHEARNYSSANGSALLWKREFHKLAGYLDLTSSKLSSLWPPFYSTSTKVNRSLVDRKNISTLPGYINPSPPLDTPNIDWLVFPKKNTSDASNLMFFRWKLNARSTTFQHSSQTGDFKETHLTNAQNNDSFAHFREKSSVIEPHGLHQGWTPFQIFSSKKFRSAFSPSVDKIEYVWISQLCFIQLVFGAVIYLFPFSFLVQLSSSFKVFSGKAIDSVIDLILINNPNKQFQILEQSMQQSTKLSLMVLLILASFSAWSTIVSLVAYVFLIVF